MKNSINYFENKKNSLFCHNTKILSHNTKIRKKMTITITMDGMSIGNLFVCFEIDRNTV